LVTDHNLTGTAATTGADVQTPASATNKSYAYNIGDNPELSKLPNTSFSFPQVVVKRDALRNQVKAIVTEHGAERVMVELTRQTEEATAKKARHIERLKQLKEKIDQASETVETALESATDDFPGTEDRRERFVTRELESITQFWRVETIREGAGLNGVSHVLRRRS
jgi:hypothetical protein